MKIFLYIQLTTGRWPTWLLACFCLLAAQTLHAQGVYTWDDFEQTMLESDDADEEDGANNDSWQGQLEELKAITENPINLVTATKEDLERLPFLNDDQIEAIQEYTYLHRPIRSLAELNLIPQLDYETIQALRLFVCTEDTTSRSGEKISLKNIAKNLHNQVDSRVDIPLYYREGFSAANGYVGDALYHRIRYTVSDKRHLFAGAHVEKDAGERYYDSWGVYAMVRNIGAVQKALVGDYRIGWGEGLVMGGGGWSGKSTLHIKAQQGIHPMTGMNETNFLRGAATTIRLNKAISLTAFFSHRKIDATLTSDGSGAQTLLSTGYHRTASERAKKDNISSTSVGGDISWQKGSTCIGASGYFQRFGLPLRAYDSSNPQTYRRYYPHGKSFGSMGLHYAHSLYRWYMGGETAISTGRKGIATSNHIEWLINEHWRMTLAQRYYSKGYYSLYAVATSESGGVRNESGATLRVQGQGLKGWNLNAYFDIFYNSWPRYNMTHSSLGQDMMAQLTRNLNPRNSILIRYQLKRKENNDVMAYHHRVKLQWTFVPTTTYRNQVTMNLHNVGGSTGVGISDCVRASWWNDMLRCSLTLDYFHTPDYQSRIYLYEPSLYNSVSSGTLFGHGMRAAATIRWTSANKRFMLEGKFSSTRFFDRATQSSGLQTIHSAWKNDISLQAVVRL